MKSMWWSHIPNIDRSSIDLPVLCGAEPDEPNTSGQGGDGGAGTPNSPAGAQGTNSGEPNTGGDTDNRDPQVKITALTEEKDRHFEAAKTAKAELDAQKTELEELRELKRLQDEEKLTAEQKTQKQIDDLTAERDEAKATVETVTNAMQELVKQQAFLSASDVKWHDPEIALSKADFSTVEIEIGKDGIPKVKNPDAVKKAAKALAESKPFLVDAGESKPWRSRSGDAPPARGNSGTKSEQDRKAELQRKYPGTRR